LATGVSSYFHPDILARVRGYENEQLKGKGEYAQIQRSYLPGECISAWVRPGADVTVTRLTRGIRLRKYNNPEAMLNTTTLLVVDIKTEEIFRSWSDSSEGLIDNLFIVRIEYDNSYQALCFIDKE